MLHFARSASIIGMPLVIASLLAWVTPAGAGISLNGITLNGITLNGLSSTGSALGDLNGVAVEVDIVPDAANR